MTCVLVASATGGEQFQVTISAEPGALTYPGMKFRGRNDSGICAELEGVEHELRMIRYLTCERGALGVP